MFWHLKRQVIQTPTPRTGISGFMMAGGSIVGDAGGQSRQGQVSMADMFHLGYMCGVPFESPTENKGQLQQDG